MNFKEQIYKLKIHASDCEMESDKTAIRFLEQRRNFALISEFQSICDFNLYWLYQISPEVVVRSSTIDFLNSNKEMFTRKIKVAEMILYDFIIFHNNIKTFDEFKSKLK